jgi:hypothetical protein
MRLGHRQRRNTSLAFGSKSVVRDVPPELDAALTRWAACAGSLWPPRAPSSWVTERYASTAPRLGSTATFRVVASGNKPAGQQRCDLQAGQPSTSRAAQIYLQAGQALHNSHNPHLSERCA